MLRKFIFRCMCMMFILLLTGCLSGYEIWLWKTLDSVELIQILNVEDGEENVLFETNDTVILDEIQNLKCWQYWNDPPSSVGGVVVKVCYNDGSYELISHYCNAYYNGKKLKYGRYYFVESEFESTILKYIENHE